LRKLSKVGPPQQEVQLEKAALVENLEKGLSKKIIQKYAIYA